MKSVGPILIASTTCITDEAAETMITRTSVLTLPIPQRVHNPMNSRDRRVIHMALRNKHDVRSESSGSQRGMVIYPAGMPYCPNRPLRYTCPEAATARGLP